MRKIVVVYQSKYGTTEKYANWIAGALSADLFEKKELSAEKLCQYDVVVYGGGLYAGGILGASLVSKSKIAHLVLFTVGLANPNTTDYTEIISRSFSEKVSQPDAVFHFRGGIDYKKLNALDRLFMYFQKKIVEKKIKNEDEESGEGNELLETYGNAIDFTSEQSIESLIDYVKNIDNP